ncbi:hypothetical protein N2152v2_000111 [Parachlorella kessleri]
MPVQDPDVWTDPMEISKKEEEEEKPQEIDVDSWHAEEVAKMSHNQWCSAPQPLPYRSAPRRGRGGLASSLAAGAARLAGGVADTFSFGGRGAGGGGDRAMARMGPPPPVMAMSAAPSFGFGAPPGTAMPATMPCAAAPISFAAPKARVAAACAPGGGAMPAAEAIGFRTGGAQDVCNLRENIAAGHLPLPSDVTFEGIAKDYFFDMMPTAQPEDGGGDEWQQVDERPTELFFPTFSLALAPDPLLAAASTGKNNNSTTTANTTPSLPGAALDEDQANGSEATKAQAGREREGEAPATHAAPDVFLSVGLDSGLTGWSRPKLNLMLLLDLSGSMGASFNSYYYDRATGQQRQLSTEESRVNKLDVAKDVMLGIMGKLKEDDSLGIALFSDAAAVPKPLGPMRTARLDGIRSGIQALQTIGCTNLQVGMDLAAAQFRQYPGCAPEDALEVENRIIILTDAAPNSGDFTPEGLTSRIKAYALDGIHTTVIGIGLDFNSELIEDIGKVRGANYFSVHSPGDFKERLCDEFDMVVSPLVYDLTLKLDPASQAAGWKILHAYGTPNPQDTALSQDGTVMKVHTLFPSPKTEEGVKGGVVLLRMQPPAAAAVTAAGDSADDSSSAAEAPAPLSLTATYRDRSLQLFSCSRRVPIPPALLAGNATAAAVSEEAGAVEPLFQSTGVRKAVALARYVDALQSWLVDQWGVKTRRTEAPAPGYLAAFGAGGTTAPAGPGAALGPTPCWLCPGRRLVPPAVQALGRWERVSSKLEVNPRAKEAFTVLAGYLAAESDAVADADMRQEVELLQKLLAA